MLDRDFLEHVAATSSQYDGTCRQLAQGLLDIASNAQAARDTMFVEFCEIIHSRDEAAWKQMHLGTIRELVRVAIATLVPHAP